MAGRGSSDLGEPLLGAAAPAAGAESPGSAARRGAFLNERRRVRVLCAWLGAVALADGALGAAALAAGRGVGGWDVSRDTADVGALCAVRCAALAALAVLNASLGAPSWSWYVSGVAYWAVYVSLSFGGAKLIAFEWGAAPTARARWVLFAWLASGVAELLVLSAQMDWIAEQLRWVPGAAGSGSAGAFGLVKEDEVPDAEEDIEAAVKKMERKEKADKAAQVSVIKTLWSRTALRLIRPFFWPDGWANRLRSMLNYLFVALGKVGSLLQPLVFGRAVQALSEPSTPLSRVAELIVLNAALKVGTDLLGRLQDLVYNVVCRTAEVELSSQTFAHIHSMSLDWHLKKKMGSVLRSMDRGVSAAESLVDHMFVYLVPGVLESIAVLAIMRQHFGVATITGVAFFGAMIFLAMTVRMAFFRKKLHESVNKEDNAYHDMATDSLVNFETVKYFGTEQYEVSRYTAALRRWRQHTMTRTYLWAAQASLQNLIICTCTAGALLIAARGVRAEPPTLKVGDFVSIAAYVASVFSPIQYVGMFMVTVVQAVVDMQNLIELLEERSEVEDAPGAPPIRVPGDIANANANASAQTSGAEPAPAPAPALAIEFDRVRFHYPSQTSEQGLKGVSFAVPRGTTTAVVGATGAGKSTLGRLLFRFYDPQAGAVRVFGQDVRAVQQLTLRQAIGIVSQDVTLFNESILHNVSYGCPGASKQQVECACEQAQLLDFIRTLPHGFATKVGERGLKLSGGEKQRVAIARCLLKNPSLIVLDESTSALDSQTERSVQAAISTLTLQRTVLVIAHRLTTIAHAEQIVVMDKGAIVERGRHAELLQAGGAYAALWNAPLIEQQRLGMELLREPKQEQQQQQQQQPRDEDA
jgi:ABC-type transport system involved in Fe-S cluster assembly fused permease/ATPase subunit